MLDKITQIVDISDSKSDDRQACNQGGSYGADEPPFSRGMPMLHTHHNDCSVQARSKGSLGFIKPPTTNRHMRIEVHALSVAELRPRRLKLRSVLL